MTPPPMNLSLGCPMYGELGKENLLRSIRIITYARRQFLQI